MELAAMKHGIVSGLNTLIGSSAVILLPKTLFFAEINETVPQHASIK